jgi:hypothetical protein
MRAWTFIFGISYDLIDLVILSEAKDLLSLAEARQCPFAALRMTIRGMLQLSGTLTPYFFFASSAIYTISCLKMNRFGPSSRVTRTMFLS